MRLVHCTCGFCSKIVNRSMNEVIVVVTKVVITQTLAAVVHERRDGFVRQ